MRSLDPKIVDGKMGFVGRMPGHVYRMGSPKVPTSASGTSLTLSSAAAPLTGLTIYGKSEQKTTTGVQLYNESDESLYLNGYYVGANNTFTPASNNYGFCFVLPIGDYVYTQIGVSTDVQICAFSKFPQSGATAVWEKKQTVPEGQVKIEFNVSESAQYIFVKYTHSAAEAIKSPEEVRKSIMLNSGSTALPWEPYTGGAPSPSPDYPQEIKSVGDSGEIEVNFTGAQLFDASVFDDNTANGVSVTVEDGEIVLAGTVEKDTFIHQRIPLPIGEYTVYYSLDNASNNTVAFGIQAVLSDGSTTLLTTGLVNPATFSVTDEYSEIYAQIRVAGGYNTNGTRFRVMLNYGSTILPWESYRIPQTLPVQTPNGLPGIPVDSGGNYTDADGQQWVCDEVDFEREVYVQRIGTHLITKVAENILNSRQKNPDFFGCENTLGPSGIGYDKSFMSDKLLFAGINKNIDGAELTIAPNNGIMVFGLKKSVVSEATAEAVTNYLSENPITVLYALATPIETPLSPSDLAAYSALRTYSPTTVVSNDAGAWIKVGYYSYGAIERLVRWAESAERK